MKPASNNSEVNRPTETINSYENMGDSNHNNEVVSNPSTPIETMPSPSDDTTQLQNDDIQSYTNVIDENTEDRVDMEYTLPTNTYDEVKGKRIRSLNSNPWGRR